MTVISSESFTKVTKESEMAKGPLVRVEIGPGRFVKMRKADAERQTKMRQPAQNKMAGEAAESKGEATPLSGVLEPVDQPSDDFTEIDGIGKASARAIQANGILTLAQLREAEDLSFLPTQARQAVEEWRKGSGD